MNAFLKATQLKSGLHLNGLCSALLLMLFLSSASANAGWKECEARGESVFCNGEEKISLTDLESRPFIHSGTDLSRAGTLEREGTELESTRRLTVRDSGDKLVPFDRVAMFKSLRNSEWNGFRSMRNTTLMEAFSLHYGVNEMPWDEASHQLREQTPYLTVHISESRSQFRPRGTPGGLRRLRVSTDLMDDIYYDDAQYSLLDYTENAVRAPSSVRGRVRYNNWRNPSATDARILIAFKKTVVPGPNDVLRVKRALKIDERISPAKRQMVTDLTPRIQSGRNSWDGKPTPALIEAYNNLSGSGELPTIGRYKDVLSLQPKVFLRSIRSRYHLDETRPDQIGALQGFGREHLNSFVALAKKRFGSGMPAPVSNFVEKVERVDRELLKRTGLTEKQTKDAVSGLLNSIIPKDSAGLSMQKETSHHLSDIYHELAGDLKKSDFALMHTILGVVSDQSLNAEAFIDWLRRSGKTDPDTGKFYRVLRQEAPFLSEHKRLVEGNVTDLDNARIEVGSIVGHAISPAEFLEIGRWLQMKNAEDQIYQISESGTAMKRLYFLNARGFYVPFYMRPNTNLFIDTLDLTGIFRGESGNDADLLSAELVNEVQIELRQEKPFMDRISFLNQGIDNAMNAGDSVKELVELRDGAMWVLDQYLQTQNQIAEAKATHVIDGVEAAFPYRPTSQEAWHWEISTLSKGERSMRLIRP